MYSLGVGVGVGVNVGVGVGALARVHLSRVALCLFASFTSSFSTAVSTLSTRVVVVTAEHRRRRTSIAAESRNDDDDDDDDDDGDDDGDDTPHCSRLIVRCGRGDRQQERFPRARTRGASSFAAGTEDTARISAGPLLSPALGG